jgi:hypothetical protein
MKVTVTRLRGKPLAEGDPISTTLPFVRAIRVHDGSVRVMTAAGVVFDFPITEWRVTAGEEQVFDVE